MTQITLTARKGKKGRKVDATLSPLGFLAVHRSWAQEDERDAHARRFGSRGGGRGDWQITHVRSGGLVSPISVTFGDKAAAVAAMNRMEELGGDLWRTASERVGPELVRAVQPFRRALMDAGGYFNAPIYFDEVRRAFYRRDL